MFLEGERNQITWKKTHMGVRRTCKSSHSNWTHDFASEDPYYLNKLIDMIFKSYYYIITVFFF